MSEMRRGFWFGVAAYAMWGLFPLYWRLLDEAGAAEVLAARVVSSVLVVLLLVVALRRLDRFRAAARDRRTRWLMLAAAALISTNWFTFIWGVTNERVLETSLGYFVNPLVSVLLGVLVLGERLRRLQWVAVGVAGVAVVVLAVDYGRVPWVAITLALSFGFYGLVKKTADVGATEGLLFETLLAAPVALVFLGWLAADGSAWFPDAGTGGLLLLLSTGLVTAVPLLCFGAAAVRVPLTTIGLLQYLAPSIQFALGILVFAEPLPASRLAGFALVWAALAVFTYEAVAHRRRQLRLQALSIG